MSETLLHCIRPWCVLDVRLIKQESLSEKESVPQPGNHNVMNVEDPVFPLNWSSNVRPVQTRTTGHIVRV